MTLGIPELIAAVERDEMAVSLASEIARAPADVQREAVEGGWAVAKSIAKRIKQERRDKRRAAERAAWRIACDEIAARREIRDPYASQTQQKAVCHAS